MPLSLTETKSLCHIAYDGRRGERYRFHGGQIWTVTNHWATSITGFKAVLLSGEGKAVLTFAGTDSLIDAVVDLAQVGGQTPAHYDQALVVA